MTILAENTWVRFTSVGNILLIVAVTVLACSIRVLIEDGLSIFVFICVLFAIGVASISIIYYREPYKIFKVVLQDDYPAAELYDNYNVKGREGEIWILTEKKTEERE